MFPLSLAPGLAGSYRLSYGAHRAPYLGAAEDSIFMMAIQTRSAAIWCWYPRVAFGCLTSKLGKLIGRF